MWGACVWIIRTNNRDATSRHKTHNKKTRYKRATKVDHTHRKLKKIKVCEDTSDFMRSSFDMVNNCRGSQRIVQCEFLGIFSSFVRCSW
jgi:hypothetical protein